MPSCTSNGRKRASVVRELIQDYSDLLAWQLSLIDPLFWMKKAWLQQGHFSLSDRQRIYSKQANTAQIIPQHRQMQFKAARGNNHNTPTHFAASSRY